jgi:hypothetical protein
MCGKYLVNTLNPAAGTEAPVYQQLAAGCRIPHIAP